MTPIHWESVYFGPPPPRDELRGSFHLAIDADQRDALWTDVKNHTSNGRLGYMSSRSPNSMEYFDRGPLKDKFVICVHVVQADKNKLRRSLECLGLFPYAFKYDVIWKFRKIYFREYLEYFNDYNDTE